MAQHKNSSGGGAVFRNQFKKKPTHPDFRGEVTIDGVEYEVSMWEKPGSVESFFSLGFRKKIYPKTKSPRDQAYDKALRDIHIQAGKGLSRREDS